MPPDEAIREARRCDDNIADTAAFPARGCRSVRGTLILPIQRQGHPGFSLKIRCQTGFSSFR